MVTMAIILCYQDYYTAHSINCLTTHSTVHFQGCNPQTSLIVVLSHFTQLVYSYTLTSKLSLTEMRRYNINAFQLKTIH